MNTVSTATENCARSQDSERTLFYPDLHGLTNADRWTMTPVTHKYAVAAGSFCFLSIENGDQQDTCNLITMTCVQRSLYLDERTNNFCNMKIEVPRRVDGRTRETCWNAVSLLAERAGRNKGQNEIPCNKKEASAQEVRGYYKQFAEAKHLEYRSWVDSEVFDLIDIRKVKPRNSVTGRWLLTIKTDEQGNFLKAKARWVLRGFPDKQKEYQQTDFCASTRPGFRMTCQMVASTSWTIFHIDLKRAFLRGKSYGVKRDVVCQLPPEAGHPRYKAARLKNAYGMNDAPRRWWKILDKTAWFPVELIDAVACGTLYSRVSEPGNKITLHTVTMLHLRKCWIPLQKVQVQENPW